jgi:hypothetical protein
MGVGSASWYVRKRLTVGALRKRLSRSRPAGMHKRFAAFSGFFSSPAARSARGQALRDGEVDSGSSQGRHPFGLALRARVLAAYRVAS